MEPLCLTYQYDYYFRELSVRIDSRYRAETLSLIETKWKDRFQDQEMDYRFLDEEIDQLYKADKQVGQMIAVLTLLAISISCFGLIGLVVYNTERRVKEIGIRKVLGATVSSIVILLSKDFIKLVLIAVVIASPIAWLTMNRWLEDFAYRIHIHWWMFAVAGLAAIIIALLTVSWQAIRAAVANPIDSLRNE